MSSLPLWPHQERGIREVIDAINAGEQRICLTAPTGGKSRMMTELLWWAKSMGKRTVVYTNRKMLLDRLAALLVELAADADADREPVVPQYGAAPSVN